MNPKQRIAVSKFLSRHLRHAPEDIGIVLEPGGWADVDALLAGCARNGKPITRAELDEAVRTSVKQRFAFDAAGIRIRANQGHSTPVDLQLRPVEPPPILYHGTGRQNVDLIRQQGLKKMARHHVHLSRDIAAARKVSERHGRPIVFIVDSAAMHAHGVLFFCSANGVWLADAVPAEFLRLLTEHVM